MQVSISNLTYVEELLHGVLTRFEEANKGSSRVVDILDDAAMENALNICHNVQVMFNCLYKCWSMLKNIAALIRLLYGSTHCEK